MSSSVLPIELNHFPAGALITEIAPAGGASVIRYASDYVHESFGFAPGSLPGTPLARFLTRASAILFDSHVLPQLLNAGHCSETLLEVRHPRGLKVPMIANTRLSERDTRRIYWGLFNATHRNRLYQELVEARRLLEDQARQLHQMSITDDLTGLLNRRELGRLASQVLAQASRLHQTVALLLIDIDHFKQINDEHGHAFGDRVLAEFGRRLREQGRAADVIARYGGEEFVVLIPHADRQCAERAAERLHRLMHDVDGAGRAVTVSIGLTVQEASPELSFDRLFDLADRAIYEAKARGRNRTQIVL